MSMQSIVTPKENDHRFTIPDSQGKFGDYGGSYVPETLFFPLCELEEAYKQAQSDPAFKNELEYMLKEIAGWQT